MEKQKLWQLVGSSLQGPSQLYASSKVKSTPTNTSKQYNNEREGERVKKYNTKWNTWVDGDGPIVVDCVTMLHISGTMGNNC